MDIATTDHLLSTTRAVRRKLDLERPVPDQVLIDCLRLAVQARPRPRGVIAGSVRRRPDVAAPAPNW